MGSGGGKHRQPKIGRTQVWATYDIRPTICPHAPDVIHVSTTKESKNKETEAAVNDQNQRLCNHGLVTALLGPLSGKRAARPIAVRFQTEVQEDMLRAPVRSVKMATPSETHFGEPDPNDISARVFREAAERAPNTRVEELSGTDR